MTYIITENCIKCKYTDCVEVCPVDCFHEGPNFLVINPDECIDCSLCEPECPIDAIISDENIKSQILSNSIFAISKSGTVSLQISSANVPSIIIYKLSFINFMIFKLFVNVKFANIINIINGREVIPELLQNECNAKEIFNTVIYFLKNPDLIKKQLSDCNKTLEGIRSKTSSSNESASILNKYLAF